MIFNLSFDLPGVNQNLVRPTRNKILILTNRREGF